ncbi:MAG: winged helix-turn-helix transcriptional regulator [Gammaproteobacteria bacterium]|nr:winged helix-turn-helix transcriptional regulator [Gammaproteobacteria bacterium]
MNTRPEKLLERSPDKESQLTLELLQAIDLNDDISQRGLAQEMGVALGLANSYLKRCVKKGWIKITTAPANRYLYYLTPNGFAEKARLTGEFLSTSLALFRQSGDVYSELLADAALSGHQRLLFAGLSDLTEIAYMRSLQSEVEVMGVYQPGAEKAQFYDLRVHTQLDHCPPFDAIVMTSMEQTHVLLAELEQLFTEQQILVPPMLLNMHYRNDEETPQSQLNDTQLEESPPLGGQ